MPHFVTWFSGDIIICRKKSIFPFLTVKILLSNSHYKIKSLSSKLYKYKVQINNSLIQNTK